jgi:Lrp/AsnC family transcriptional regulator, leucine-responsive regulatory protein
MKIDPTDQAILDKIQQNALLTTKELAADLGLSYTPVYERVRKLEKEGVIKKYVALIDRDKIGKKLMVFCNVSLKEHSRSNGEKFVKAVLAFTEVMECHNISGGYDFMLKVVVNDMPEYQQFLMNKLGALDCIGNTHSIFVMSEIKNETAFQITTQPD